MNDIVQEAEMMLARVRILQLWASFCEEQRLLIVVMRKATVVINRMADILEVTDDPSM